MTEQEWWEELNGKPPEDVTWNLFADWLNDQGECGKADGAWEVFTKGLKPNKGGSFELGDNIPSFDWWVEGRDYYQDIPTSAQLPEKVFKHLTGWKPAPRYEDADWREYHSPLEAYQDLLNAYAKAHEERSVRGQETIPLPK